jgi:hypothetical protein
VHFGCATLSFSGCGPSDSMADQWRWAMSRNPKPINAGLELKLARRRAQDCVSEAATILVDAMPLVPRDQSGVKSAENPEGYAKYEFALSDSPDSTWQGLFYQNVALNKDAAPRFAGTQMILVCDPANLEIHYGKIRLAIQTTNAMYRTERENVFRIVEQEMVKREAQAKQKTEEEEKIKRAFDELEL